MVVGLLGTDFCSSNRGCGALGYSAVEIMNSVYKKKGEKLEVYAFLYKSEPEPQISDDNVTMHYVVIQYKKFSFWKNANNIFKKCDFVWDFTGGDSFSDIYGMKRFCLNSAVKELALKSKTKFLMAPQTIGPFEKKCALLWAKHIVKKANLCFVRDSMSEEYMKRTFGVNPVVTTDVAFALPYEQLNTKDNEKICIGFNPSGLLWDGTETFCASKHITVEYKEYVAQVLKELCKDSRYEVVLIPHVFVRNLEAPENDLKACMEIKEMFPDVRVECDFETPMEAKQAISTMDIFVGARMHATIAAFSAGVVTIPFSYSRKFEGIYQDLNYPYIISATCMETKEAVTQTLEWIKNVEPLVKCLEDAGPRIKERQKALLDVLNRY